MKKLVLTSLVCVMAMSVVAAPRFKAKLPPPPKVDDGPMVNVVGEGKISVIDCTDGVADKEAMASAVETLSKVLNINTSVEKGCAEDKFVGRDMHDGNIVVFVEKSDKLPMSLIALESHYAIVNANELEGIRLKKEIVRAFTVLLGAANSRYPASAMQNVSIPADLDNCGEILAFDALMTVSGNLENLGLKPNRIMSYREACYEGAAAKPSNEREQKIWDEVEADK